MSRLQNILSTVLLSDSVILHTYLNSLRLVFPTKEKMYYKFITRVYNLKKINLDVYSNIKIQYYDLFCILHVPAYLRTLREDRVLLYF